MRNEINANIYTTDLTNIEKSNDAWRMGRELFYTTLNNQFALLDKEILFKFLNQAAKLQDENGYIVLFKDETVPGDARVDIIYKPTYATATVALYAFDCYEADFDNDMKNFLQKLLNAFEGGIKGHGFDAADTVCETMELLSRDCVKKFIKQYPEMSDKFYATIKRYLAEFENALSRGENITHGFDITPVNHRLQKIVSFWAGKTKPVFVYGTLLKGEKAHYLLQDADYCGKFALQNCAMFDLGDFPGIKRRKGEQVIGEVYFVTEQTLEKLDRYEGEGTLYKRNMAQAKNESLAVVCYAYFYLGEVGDNEIIRKPWNANNKDYVWYAGYGSNLSEKRFSYYIKGGICNSNGIRYNGCSDKSDWLETKTAKFKGRMYFGNQSRSWCGKGVAFFDENGENNVQMKLYKITRGQFEDVQLQEGSSAIWYGKTVFLGFDKDGCEIYTLTSEELRPENEPAAEYIELIKNALKNDCGYTAKSALSYIEGCKISI